jgi:hypothetical protein
MPKGPKCEKRFEITVNYGDTSLYFPQAEIKQGGRSLLRVEFTVTPHFTFLKPK